MRLYAFVLTKEEALARFEAALAEMRPSVAGTFRECVNFDEAPGEGALWLRQAVGPEVDVATIGALRRASVALLGYHNTLVRQAALAEQRAEHERDPDDDDDECWSVTRERPAGRVDDVAPGDEPTGGAT